MDSPWIHSVTSALERYLSPELARVVIALAVLVAGYLLARIARFAITRVFRRLSTRLASLSQRASQRAGLSPQSATEAEQAATRIAGQVVFWLVFSLFLGVATSLLGFPVLSSWLASLAGYLPRVLAAAAIVLFGVLSALLLRVLVTAAASKSRMPLARTLGRVIQISVIGLAGAVAIESLGLQITFLIVVAAIALAGIVGGAALAFALGARAAVGNLLASHYLSRFYRVGQRVRIGEREGRILEILPEAVVVRSAGDKLYIPASLFAEQPSVLVAGESDADAGDA